MYRNTNTFAPCSMRRVNTKRTKQHTPAHTCRICGYRVHGAASICPTCLWKMSEKGGTHNGK